MSRRLRIVVRVLLAAFGASVVAVLAAPGSAQLVASALCADAELVVVLDRLGPIPLGRPFCLDGDASTPVALRAVVQALFLRVALPLALLPVAFAAVLRWSAKRRATEDWEPTVSEAMADPARSPFE
jgi:hypothetical protein